MEFATAVWGTGKKLRNLIFGDVEISLVVIQLEVTGLKKTEKDRVRVPPSYYLEGRGRRGGAI